MNTNIHDVVRVEIDPIHALDENGCSARHITVTTKEGMRLDFTLFAESKEALEIETQKVVKI